MSKKIPASGATRRFITGGYAGRAPGRGWHATPQQAFKGRLRPPKGIFGIFKKRK